MGLWGSLQKGLVGCRVNKRSNRASVLTPGPFAIQAVGENGVGLCTLFVLHLPRRYISCLVVLLGHPTKHAGPFIRHETRVRNHSFDQFRQNNVSMIENVAERQNPNHTRFRS